VDNNDIAAAEDLIGLADRNPNQSPTGDLARDRLTGEPEGEASASTPAAPPPPAWVPVTAEAALP
jgi:hypothetical protein